MHENIQEEAIFELDEDEKNQPGEEGDRKVF